MSLWRLEWLRLVRTRRLFALHAVYAFFGLTGPLTARYLAEILGAVGTEGLRVRFSSRLRPTASPSSPATRRRSARSSWCWSPS